MTVGVRHQRPIRRRCNVIEMHERAERGIAAHGGVPLIYMGDEIAVLNDYSYLEDPDLRHDSRWVHRPRMDWETVERVRLDTKDFQFLYAEGDDLVFMDNDTYEQITLPGDLLGDARPFLQDGMQVALELWDEKPISVELPAQVEATIVEADAVVKGQTASSSYKPAILDNGVRIMVPPHIGSGTRIIVDVYEQAYVGKAN